MQKKKRSVTAQIKEFLQCALMWIRRLSHFDHGLQLDGVSCKFADAIRQLLHGHTVFVVLPAERLLVQMNLLQIAGLGCTHRSIKKFKPPSPFPCSILEPSALRPVPFSTLSVFTTVLWSWLSSDSRLGEMVSRSQPARAFT